MAIAERSGSRATAQTNAVQVGQTMQSGSMLACFAYWENADVTFTNITDTDAGTWVVAEGPDAGSEGETGVIAVRYNVGATQPTVTCNVSGLPSWERIRLAEFTGVAIAAAADQSNTFTEVGETLSHAGSVTPTENGELILAAFFSGAGSGWTPMGSPAFTEIHDAGSNCWEFYVQLTIAAINPTATSDTSGNATGMVATFKKEAAGGGSVVASIVQHME